MPQLTHDEARASLAERLDWDLDPARREALEAHLADCSACRDADAEYRRDRAALRQLRAPQPPRDLWARTAAALDREAGRRHPAPAPSGTGAQPRPSPTRPLPGTLDAGGRRRRLRFGSAFASLTLLAIAVVAGSQLLPGGLLAPGPNPTPIALTPEPLAYIAVQGNQLVLVRSRLDHVCPTQAIDCSDLPASVNQVVAVPAAVNLNALAVDPLGEHAAVAGQMGNQTTFYVINLPPLPVVTPAVPASAPGTGASLPPGVSGSTATAGAQGASPLSTASPSTSPATTVAPPSAAHTVRPSPTARHTASPTPTRSPGAAARTHQPGRASASPTAAPTKAGSGHLASPAPAGTGTPAGSGGTGTTAGSGGTGAPEATGGSVLPGGASAGPAGSVAASGIPEIAVTQVILSNVVPTGLPAAWAPDGSTLAFSAMPADGSHGSDIYTWQPGDILAVPVTHDHDSYFASWAGNQIVGSNALTPGGDPLHLQARSFVIDLPTGLKRPLRLDNVWLPSVDPTGRFVAFWHGNLSGSGALPLLGQGELDFEQWSALNPFAQAGPTASPTPAASAAATATHGSSAGHSQSPTPRTATATPKRATGSPRQTPVPPRRATASPGDTTETSSTAVPTATSAMSARHERIPDLLEPTPTASPAVVASGPQPIFPEGSPVASTPAGGPTVEGSGGPPQPSTAGPATAADAGTPAPESSTGGSIAPEASAASSGDELGEAAPSGTAGSPAASPSAGGEPTGALPTAGSPSAVIGDYAIAWASDGSALGVWRADTPGALDGFLSVFSIDPTTGVLVVDPPFLGPTPAQRYFSMGRDRIAWTTPPDLSGSCQLHVMAWGPFGRGELRRSLDQQRLLTAF